MNIAGSDHPLKARLSHAIAGCETAEDTVEAVMAILHAERFVTYRGEQELPFLTAAGRVMADLALHPDSSLRELAVRQGTTESTVTRQMTNLVEAGLVERTRVGQRNHYRLNLNRVLNHPEINLLLEAVIVSARTVE